MFILFITIKIKLKKHEKKIRKLIEFLPFFRSCEALCAVVMLSALQVMIRLGGLLPVFSFWVKIVHSVRKAIVLLIV